MKIEFVRRVLLLMIPLILLGAVYYLYSYKPFSSRDNPILPTQPLKVTPTMVTSDMSEIQAWIYPGAPSCTAMTEIQDGRKIDVLKAEFYKVAEDGNVILLTEEDDGCNAFSEQNITLIKKYSTKQYATVSSDHINMRVLFSDQSISQKSIEDLSAFVNKYGLSGIELDFEDFSSWTAKDYADYLDYVTRLGTALSDNNKSLILDGPPLTKDMQQYYTWNYQDFNSLPVDQIIVMAYDYQYDEGPGAFVAPNNWVKEVITYIKPQFNSIDKLVIGIPSYGYHAGADRKFKLDTLEQSKKLPGFASAKLSPESFENYWQRDGTSYVFQTTESLNKKMSFIKSLGVEKISVWHLGGNAWF